MRRSFSWWEALLAAGAVLLLVVLLMPALLQAKQGCGGTNKCSSNIRQLALAASAYAGDRRFFPHVNGLRQLDGDWTSSDAPRVLVALIHYGYLDSNEDLVCPSSFDLYSPMAEAQIDDRRLWTFGPPGTRNPNPSASPLNPANPVTGSLVNNGELSYGWTRMPMNANVRGKQLLSADRSVRQPGTATDVPPGAYGNHTEGWNVAYVDASTEYLSLRYDRGDGVEPFDYLGATSNAVRDGFLAVEWAGANPAGKQP